MPLSTKTLAILRKVDAQRAAFATHEKRRESAKRAARRREDRAQRERREQKRYRYAMRRGTLALIGSVPAKSLDLSVAQRKVLAKAPARRSKAKKRPH